MFIEYKQLFHWHRTFHKGREFARCRRVIAGALMFTAAAGVAQAAPTGGVVDSGSADISLGNDTVINQHSRRVDIDWTGFDTTSNESVTFNQAYGSSAVAINRISGARTQFDGALNANGQVFLINRNGITFGSSARINVGSLLATTADTERMDGDGELLNAQVYGGDSYAFYDAGYASVVNEGDITVSNGGFAVLAAPRVENQGYIRADLGQIALVSTRQFRLNVDFRGDGLITFEVPQQAYAAEEALEDGPLGVENGASGVLQARSGHVFLATAQFAGEVVQSAINLNGVIDADQFVDNGNGGIEMVAADYGHSGGYPGGEILVVSAGDINIGGGTDIHAIGGEKVSARIEAEGSITMGAEGDPARITLRADSKPSAYDGYGAESYGDHRGDDAVADAYLEMIAGQGKLDIVEGAIEVTARAGAGNPGDVTAAYAGDGHGTGGARARAVAFLQGGEVSINADITVAADAVATAGTCGECGGRSTGGSQALAVLDVFASANGQSSGDITVQGDIKVAANARTDGAGPSLATANAVLAAPGDLTVTGDIDVDAGAISRSTASTDIGSSDAGYGAYCNDGSDTAGASANAALVMLGGMPRDLRIPLHGLSLRDGSGKDALSDILTLSDTGDLLGRYDGFTGLDTIAAGFGDGNVTYTGDINVRARAEFDATGSSGARTTGQARSTSAALIAGGGDTFINTDPVRVDAQAYADYSDADDGYYRVTGGYGDGGDEFSGTEARSFLVIAAGVGDHQTDDEGGDAAGAHDLTILGDVSATALERNTLNGVPYPYPDNPQTGALTALLATGDITVRGADPLAEAGSLADPGRTARAQGRTSRWQDCDLFGCNPVTPGTDGLNGLVQGGSNVHLAQLIIEAGGDIDIQPKPTPKPPVVKTQPSGLFIDPVGPGWPGDQPLRFAADGRMLVATGADATRPPSIAALPGDVEAAILAGGDPSTLLPPTASGGCVAAGRDAYTIGDADFYDRLVSSSCESVRPDSTAGESTR